jgi:hypothetical protein
MSRSGEGLDGDFNVCNAFMDQYFAWCCGACGDATTHSSADLVWVDDVRRGIPFEQINPDYLLWGCFRSSFAMHSSSTPAGCLFQLKHGLDEAARGAKSGCKK